jgi:serine protease inhibitor
MSCEQYDMHIVLPHTNNQTVAITFEQFKGIKYSNKDGTIIMPRFKHKHRFSVKEYYEMKGVLDLFDEFNADLSNMCEPDSNNIFISKIDHVVVVIVDENGVEGAAATVCEMDMCFGFSDDDKYTFIADHPFQYLITKSIDSKDIVIFNGIYQ